MQIRATPDAEDEWWLDSSGANQKTAVILGVIATIAFFSFLMYANGILTPAAPSCSQVASTTSTGGFTATSQSCVSLGVAITHQGQRFADPTLLARGMKASCLIFCNGITYTEG